MALQVSLASYMFFSSKFSSKLGWLVSSTFKIKTYYLLLKGRCLRAWEKVKCTKSPSLGAGEVSNMNISTVHCAKDDARSCKTVQVQDRGVSLKRKV